MIEDCIECQTNKRKIYHFNGAPLEQWGELKTSPIKTKHIDHKGPLRPSSKSKTHCFVVVNAFSRFLGAHLVIDTRAQTTINALRKWITSNAFTQKIVHGNGSAFKNNDSINWTKESGINLAPRTSY